MREYISAYLVVSFLSLSCNITSLEKPEVTGFYFVVLFVCWVFVVIFVLHLNVPNIVLNNIPTDVQTLAKLIYSPGTPAADHHVVSEIADVWNEPADNPTFNKSVTVCF